jgi:hypothetical protein
LVNTPPLFGREIFYALGEIFRPFGREFLVKKIKKIKKADTKI